MGQLIGGFVAIFILSALVEWAAVKRIADDPVKGKLVSASIAYAIAVILSGFGMANGGPFTFIGMIIYLPGFLVVAALGYRRGVAIRQQVAGEALE